MYIKNGIVRWFVGHNYLTDFAMIESWTRSNADSHGGRLSGDVSNIIKCSLHTMLLITILTLLQKKLAAYHVVHLIVVRA